MAVQHGGYPPEHRLLSHARWTDGQPPISMIWFNVLQA